MRTFQKKVALYTDSMHASPVARRVRGGIQGRCVTRSGHDIAQRLIEGVLFDGLDLLLRFDDLLATAAGRHAVHFNSTGPWSIPTASVVRKSN